MTAPSSREVDDWLNRVNDISEAVNDIFNTDPMDDIARHQAREKRRQEQVEAEKKMKLEQIKMRYEPKNYARFERDDFIDAMLKAVDENPKKGEAGAVDLKDEALYSKAERISLEEAQLLKADGGKHVQKANWEEALKCYNGAIKLDPVDPQLKIILYNNRALVCNKLGKYLQTCEDASYVLKHEPHNVKALLRRGTALRYLHRPVEALQDVSQALRYEPQNAEGLILRTWLHRAEEELVKSEQFMEKCEKNGTPDAENVCQAAEALSKLSVDECEQLLVPLEMALRVVQLHGTGASVLFALRGGVEPTLAAATVLLQRLTEGDDFKKDIKEMKNVVGEADTPPPLVAPALYTLRLLTSLFDDCETVSQDASEANVVAFFQSATDLLHLYVQQQHETPAAGGGSGHPLLQSVVNAVLECLTSFYSPYPALLNAAMEAAWRPLSSLWGAIVAAFPHPANGSQKRTAAATPMNPLGVVTLFHYTRFLTACMQTRGNLIVLDPEEAMSTSVVQQLFQSGPPGSAADAGAEMLLDVVEHCLHDEVPLPIQTVGVALALRRTSIMVKSALDPTAKSAAVSSATRKATPAQFTRESWSKHLCNSILSALRVVGNGKHALDHPHHLRFLEAGYSLVYNLTLSAADRGAFVQLWETLRTPSFSRATWDYIVAHQQHEKILSSDLLSAVQSKMLGVLSKFVAVSPEVRTIVFRSSSSSKKKSIGGSNSSTSLALPPLWALLEELTNPCTPLDAKRGNEKQWELLEHVTTILAVQLQSVAAADSADADEELLGMVCCSGMRSLLSLLQVALPPSETTVQLWKASSAPHQNTTNSGASGRASSRPSIAIVALGNAANLVGQVMDASTKNTPQQHRKAVRVLMELDAVGVVLESLRTTRTSVLMLARERADAESKRMTQIIPQLQLWEKHSLAAQKNLGIAVSKVVTASDAMRARLRELNGLETLAAVLGK